MNTYVSAVISIPLVSFPGGNNDAINTAWACVGSDAFFAVELRKGSLRFDINFVLGHKYAIISLFLANNHPHECFACNCKSFIYVDSIVIGTEFLYLSRKKK